MNGIIVALGELLIDFTPSGVSPQGRALYEQNPGGAPANVLAAVSRQGGRGALITCVGDDFFGHFLKGVMEREGVDTRGVQFVSDAATTLAFVSLDERGDRSFCFCRKPGADMLLDRAKLDVSLLRGCSIFHFGSLSLSAPTSREATLFAVETARDGGAIISYDPNWRESLWTDMETGVAQMKSGLKYARLLKLSEEELLLLSGCGDPEEGAQRLSDLYPGIRLIVVTLGPRGLFYKLGGATGTLPTYDVKVVDTTGAGDAFWGSLLSGISANPGLLESGDIPSLEKALDRANASGSLCASGRGAIDAIPTSAQIDELVKTGIKLT